MPRQLGGCRFDCSLHEEMERQVFFAGCYAAQEIAFLRHVLKPGMSFVDVGAAWGLFALVAAHQVGRSGTVIAFEPDPRMLAKLKANIERNNLTNTHVCNVAVADREGELRLVVCEQVPGWKFAQLSTCDATDDAGLSVRSRRLDTVLDEAGARNVDLVKIDVEGAEDLVLTGMRAGLSNWRYRNILLELHPLQLASRGRTAREVAEGLMAQGYRGYAVDESDAAARKAYYRPWLHFSEFIRPLDIERVEIFPHTLWRSPEQAH